MDFVFKSGNGIFIGMVSQDARSNVTKSGKRVTNFSLRYGKAEGGGKGKGKFITCTAWGDIAEYCAGLEYGDTVMAIGYLEKDDYASEKKGEEVKKLICQMVIVQPKANNLGEYHDYDETYDD